MQKETYPIRINSTLKKKFLSTCSSEGKTGAEVVRQLIENYVEGHTDMPQASLSKTKTNCKVKSPIKKNINSKNVQYKVGELFCGPGGLGLAAVQTKINVNDTTHEFIHEWASDYDNDTCQTYKLNVTDGKEDSVFWKDVKKLDIDSLNPIDGFMYGFPCNDFSIVGETKGFDGEYGPLYTYGVKVLNKHNPKWFLAENVGGLSSANGGKAFKKILEDLAGSGDKGYQLTVNLFKFEEYGIPQARHRVIIIGIRNDLEKTFEVPVPTSERRTSREAIEIPPILDDAYNNELTRQSATVVERLTHILPGQNAWNSDLPERLKLNVKSARLSQIYKRLDPDLPSYTVTGSGGGGTHVYHWKEPRALTNRERARLQTFPDSFKFLGTKESVRKQVGMAVPVDGAKVVLEAVLNTMAGVDYESTEPSLGYFGEKSGCTIKKFNSDKNN